MKKIGIRTFLKNLNYLRKNKLFQHFSDIQYRISNIEQSMNDYDIKNKILKDKIIQYYEEHTDVRPKYEHELNYLSYNPLGLVFPYKQLKVLDFVCSGYDDIKKLPYVMHDGKRLYFPSTWTEKLAVITYKNYIEKENLLGGGYKEKAPHQYETDHFKVEDGDILIDVGCAEALFTLHHIEQIKKAYLIESEKYWIDALEATFEPYKDKIILINKLASDRDSETSIRLSSIIKEESKFSLFIKMDIEGAEVSVLNECKEVISKKSDIKVVACTYHNQNDADILSLFLTSCGFVTEFSEGYMLFIYYTELRPPYFRKGLIRASK